MSQYPIGHTGPMIQVWFFYFLKFKMIMTSVKLHYIIIACGVIDLRLIESQFTGETYVGWNQHKI